MNASYKNDISSDAVAEWVLKIFLVVIAGPIIWLLISALDGFVLSNLWRWFITPFGLMPISLWHASGLSIMISLMAWQYIAQKDGDKWYNALMWNITVSLCALLGGLIIHTFFYTF